MLGCWLLRLVSMKHEDIQDQVCPCCCTISGYCLKTQTSVQKKNFFFFFSLTQLGQIYGSMCFTLVVSTCLCRVRSMCFISQCYYIVGTWYNGVSKSHIKKCGMQMPRLSKCLRLCLGVCRKWKRRLWKELVEWKDANTRGFQVLNVFENLFKIPQIQCIFLVLPQWRVLVQ